jgi:UTP--glucose-1-phosphate uridylyltransferase
MQSKIKKVVIPVAGLGTRGLPFTKVVPKELVPIIDTPAVHYIVEEAISCGLEQVIFVTSKGKSQIEDYFKPNKRLEMWLKKRKKEELLERIKKINQMIEITSVVQKDPLGLGHAVLCAKPKIKESHFCVCLGDEIFRKWSESDRYGLEFLFSKELKGSTIGVMKVEREEVRHYGIIQYQQTNERGILVEKTFEKPTPEEAPSQLAIIGRYLLSASIFEDLKRVKPNKGGEIQLTDALDLQAKRKELYAVEIKGARRFDVGNHFSYVTAQVEEALHRPELSSKLQAYIANL